MSFSIQRAVSDGTLDTIVLSIEYFDKTDISVFVDDVLLPDGTYTWAWDGLDIKITPAVANGSEVLVRRTTKFDDMYHNFDDGAVFNDTTMDDNFRQLLFIFQEGVEGLTATDFYADLNLHGYRLRKVGNAVEPDDAVPYSQYIADALGAGQFRLLAEAAATAADISKANAASSASAAAGSAAAASTSANTATTQATNASNSAIAAAASASAASTSATNAANSAAAASTSASNAAASAATAAASAASINDANLVHKTGNETVGGIKTFTSPVGVPTGVAAGDAVNKTQLDGKVGLTGNETIAGIKTFSSSPVLPGDATTALQAVPKQQLDSVRGTLQSVATTSGTTPTIAISTVDPSRILVALHGVSINGTTDIQLRLGTAGGIASTGYLGSTTAVTSSAIGTGALLSTGITLDGATAAANIYHGHIELTHVGSNNWVFSGRVGQSNTTRTTQIAGSISLGAPLTQLQLTAGGVTAFDAGAFHAISYA